jgi:Uma2 family endonuclease
MSTTIQKLSTPPSPPRTRPSYRRFAPSRIVGTMSVEEWTAFLETSKHKYHYVDGKVVQVAGASPEHNLIAMNTAVALRSALEAVDSDCEVLGSDQRVYVRERLYYFPDLVVVCGLMQVDQRDALHNPAAIVEVLSAATEKDDRTDKFRDYQQIASLRHYILIEQDRAAVTHYAKMTDGPWTIAGDYRALTDGLTLTFGETTITVPLDRIYRRVLPPESPDADAAVPEPDPAK